MHNIEKLFEMQDGQAIWVDRESDKATVTLADTCEKEPAVV